MFETVYLFKEIIYKRNVSKFSTIFILNATMVYLVCDLKSQIYYLGYFGYFKLLFCLIKIKKVHFEDNLNTDRLPKKQIKRKRNAKTINLNIYI